MRANSNFNLHQKSFAQKTGCFFSRIYQDYVDDDHDQKFSIISMAVQASFLCETINRRLQTAFSGFHRANDRAVSRPTARRHRANSSLSA